MSKRFKGHPGAYEKDPPVGEAPLDQEGGSTMKKTAKAWYITAAALVLMGCVLFIGVMSSVGWDVSRLSAVSFETRIHEIAELFRDLSLTTDTAIIVFACSEDGRCRVAC